MRVEPFSPHFACAVHDLDLRTQATPETAPAVAALMDRFGGSTEWAGYEDARAYMWHRQLHIFLYPFYYVENGIVQLCALQERASPMRYRWRRNECMIVHAAPPPPQEELAG